MPALRVTKNNAHLCTVGSSGLFMISAGVWGDVWSPEVSHLDVTGGTEEGDGPPEFLIWELLHELKIGDRLRFDFRDGTESSRPPEISRDEPQQDPTSSQEQTWPPSETEVTDLEARPLLNPGLFWRFSMNQNAETIVRPEHGRQHLSFGLLWNNRRPERIRVSLRSTSLREVIVRDGGREYVADYVPLGSYFELEIGA
jgi:hypothetical protein